MTDPAPIRKIRKRWFLLIICLVLFCYAGYLLILAFEISRATHSVSFNSIEMPPVIKSLMAKSFPNSSQLVSFGFTTVQRGNKSGLRELQKDFERYFPLDKDRDLESWKNDFWRDIEPLLKASIPQPPLQVATSSEHLPVRKLREIGRIWSGLSLRLTNSGMASEALKYSRGILWLSALVEAQANLGHWHEVPLLRNFLLDIGCWAFLNTLRKLDLSWTEAK